MQLRYRCIDLRICHSSTLRTALQVYFLAVPQCCSTRCRDGNTTTTDHCSLPQRRCSRLWTNLNCGHVVFIFSDVAHKVYFGDLKLSQKSSYHQEATVQVFRNHNYDSFSIDNDFSLLKLNTRLTINEHVRPICLAVDSNEETIYPDGTCKAVGWGDTTFEGTFKNAFTLWVVRKDLELVLNKTSFRNGIMKKKSFGFIW